MNGPDAWDAYEGLRERDPAALTRDEQLLVALGEVRQEVNSGGFDRYFRYSGGGQAPTAVDAAREIGCPALAELVEEGMSRLGSSDYPVEQDARADRLDALEVEFDDLDQRFYDVESHVELDALMEELARRIA